MLTQEHAVEIKVLIRKGKSIREIARLLGISRNTVRRRLRVENRHQYKDRQPRPSKLDPFISYLRQRIREPPPALATRHGVDTGDRSTRLFRQPVIAETVLSPTTTSTATRQ